MYDVILYFMLHFFEKSRIHTLTVFAICSKLIFFTLISILLHIYFLKRQQRYHGQHDNTVFFLILIPITSVFLMCTFVKISDSCMLSPALSWMITLSVIFLLAINLLVFGFNQYHQKKNQRFNAECDPFPIPTAMRQ